MIKIDVSQVKIESKEDKRKAAKALQRLKRNSMNGGSK